MTVGELYKRLVVVLPKDYHSYYQKVKDTFVEAKTEFPTCKEWDQFTEDMKDADVWYNVLDSPEEGKILDYLYEIMVWRERWFGND